MLLFLDHLRKQKRQAKIIVAIAQKYIATIEVPLAVYTQEQKDFIWNVYLLQKHLENNYYWKIKENEISKNDNYVFMILNFLNHNAGFFEYDLKTSEIKMVSELLTRMPQEFNTNELLFLKS